MQCLTPAGPLHGVARVRSDIVEVAALVIRDMQYQMRFSELARCDLTLKSRRTSLKCVGRLGRLRSSAPWLLVDEKSWTGNCCCSIVQQFICGGVSCLIISGQYGTAVSLLAQQFYRITMYE